MANSGFRDRTRAYDEAPALLVEQTVVLLCAVVLTVVLVWLAVSMAVCLADALRCGGPRRHGRRGAAELPTVTGTGGLLRPRLARWLVAIAVGSVATASAAPAGASATGSSGRRPAATSPAGPELPRALDGLPLPDRPYGGVRTHQVRPGESLWSITAAHLSPDAATAAVARGWPRLHRLNRHRVGSDPHLIQPGTTLRLPAWGTAPTRGATR